MRRRLLVAAAISLAAVLGLWMSLGASAAVHAPKSPTRSGRSAQIVSVLNETGTMAYDNGRSEHRNAGHATAAASDTDNIQSGDQSGPEDSATETENGSETESESEGETSVETDGVDCQQEGEFEGVNQAGSGPGCDGTGT